MNYDLRLALYSLTKWTKHRTKRFDTRWIQKLTSILKKRFPVLHEWRLYSETSPPETKDSIGLSTETKRLEGHYLQLHYYRDSQKKQIFTVEEIF